MPAIPDRGPTPRGRREEPEPRPRVKHSMRKSPYLVSLVLLLAATALSLLHIYTGDLVRVKIRSPAPAYETKYGLFQRCTRLLLAKHLQPAQPLLGPVVATNEYIDWSAPKRGPWECDTFPTRSECAKFGERFCVLWSSAGYAAQLALVPCFFALVSLLFIFLHRGQRTARAYARRKQWKLVSGAMLVHCIMQLASVGLVVHTFWTDERFERDARLARSFWFGVAAAVVSAVAFTFLTFTGMAARRGEPWAAGRSAKQARRHKRTNSGRVVTVPEGTRILPSQVVTVGEVVAAAEQDAAEIDEHTSLLQATNLGAAGGGTMRATDMA
ncbi:hypothetical protein CcaverHIS002_0603120 [Cutaneotrichosporon cavernicola]|uniref:Uncharacterized protein n=1 Tax=Cutaneotrichosporon cavernicola TaxID=279322 RepID=A0AA48L8D9_9TREE|nr:uncharacterized protein CcaverHIS019_0602590 [Cutaneotrichosporon cavernicola]BEI86025.1 hypothetical protein CcaverHIS002_0603120 [Cutaneotrichosporon cavernicola]BEI93800.1 hypothetical protein CcaverHIS019_0602590 [Cutaneotrichosporon cavernicola]BEJ01577.1 hypothetical protein CcaverHIS631_0602590 [Cutaneotrichosporon cavernicola]BEJ09343.1 hypothetical protein CcaverHIS641_0602580 [Cutaneotrichosporon cavernicola]